LPTRATIPIRTLGSGLLLGAALAVAPAPVFAEMQVSGTPKAVTIEARDAPLEEILAALNRAFGVHYQVSVNLDKRLSGTYEGSLPQVLTAILHGYNFVIYTDNGAMAVTVGGTANAPGASPGRPASSSAQVVQQPSAAAPSAQAAVSSSGVPVSDVEDVARKGPSSFLESAAGQSGAPNVARQSVAPNISPPPTPPMQSTAPSQGRPSTPAPQPRPSTAAHQPRPFTMAPQPRPSTMAPQPRPSTAAHQPRQFTGLPP
jgi:hypothetical protein